MSCCVKRMAIAIAWVIMLLTGVQAEEVGARWGTEQREREYYRVVSVPIPKGQVIEAGAFELMPDNRMAIGTRRGDIYFMSGVDDDKPRPRFDKFAEGLDEIFGLAHRKGEKDTLYVTHSAELTRARESLGRGLGHLLHPLEPLPDPLLHELHRSGHRPQGGGHIPA